MPRLLLFAACEKVLIDLDNTVSLMRLVQNIKAQVPAGVAPPLNAGSAMQWAILSIFERVPEDQGKTFEHYTAFVSNSNDTFFSTPIALFEMKTEQHRLTSHVNGMPIGRVGTHYVRGYLREKGATVWADCGRYPIQVEWATNLIVLPN